MHPRALEYKVYLAMGRLFATLKRACKEGVGYAAFVPRTRECFEECERRADAVYEMRDYKTKLTLSQRAISIIEATIAVANEEITLKRVPSVEERIATTLSAKPAPAGNGHSDAARRARQLARAAKHAKGQNAKVDPKGTGTSRKALQKRRKRARLQAA